MAELSLLRAFRFNVRLTPSFGFAGRELGTGAFQECSGLDVEMDVSEYLQGGSNDAVVRRVGRAKYSPVVLKRGMLRPAAGSVNNELWHWLQQIVSGGTVCRYDGFIEVYDADTTVCATWVFRRGLPQKIVGPQLNAKTGEVAIEELHVHHEGLRLTSGATNGAAAR